MNYLQANSDNNDLLRWYLDDEISLQLYKPFQRSLIIELESYLFKRLHRKLDIIFIKENNEI